jgi:hypothetical protein
MTIDRTNGICGALFVVIGLIFAWQSFNLELGSAFRMGPGYFPLVLAGVLILLGLVIIASALRMEGEAIGPIAWRGMVFILFAPILFGLTLRGLGFVPAIFITSLVACFASSRMTPLVAVIVSACLTIFTALVFVQGLELPFRLFGPWVGA